MRNRKSDGPPDTVTLIEAVTVLPALRRRGPGVLGTVTVGYRGRDRLPRTRIIMSPPHIGGTITG